MTPAPVEQRLRELAESARGDGNIPPDLLDRTLAHHRRRRALASASVVATAAAVALAVLVPVEVARSGGGSTEPHAGADRSAAPTSSPSAIPTVVHFSPLPVPHISGASAEPATVLMSIGAGHERLARVDSTTGTVTKWLQSSGSQALMTFNSDLSFGYQPDLVGCGATWTRIDTASGATSPAFEELGHPLEVTLASDSTRIAYVDVGRQERVPDGRGGTMPAGCPTAPYKLVVDDPSSGATAAYPIDSYDESLYPAFDASGTRLAFVWHRRVRILDLNDGTPLADAQLLNADLKSGCTQSKPLWRPASDTVLVSEECGTASAIVGYDAQSGAETYRHPAAEPGIIGSFDVDASGKHVIYSLSRLSAAGASVYAVEPSGDRRIIDDAYQVAW